MMRRVCLLISFALATTAMGGERFEAFDVDPGWDGYHNIPNASTLREVRQDFGYSATTHSGETPGEVGGTIQPDGLPAYYAKVLSPRDLDTPLRVSGVLHVPKGPGNTFLGFFNHETVNEWRAPNALGFRINQRGETFHLHTEYATSKWRASAGVFGQVDTKADRIYPVEQPGDTTHRFTLEYLPEGGPDGAGLIRATLDDAVSECVVSAAHKADEATFDRFGFLNIVKSVDSPGELWLREVEIDGAREDFTKDPGWEALNNRRTYLSAEVRPRFDIGHRTTQLAGGRAAGEIGGLFFRGDCREAAKLFYYGAKTGSLSLAQPLHLSGRLTLRRGVSDSTSLFGFFNGKTSVEVSDSQKHATPKDFLGIAVEGPSGEGFYVYPVVRSGGDAGGSAPYSGAPRIYPDGVSRAWALDYDPISGEVVVALDAERVRWAVPEDVRTSGAQFDHLGFVSPWIDGNGQRIYIDDLRYTVADK